MNLQGYIDSLDAFLALKLGPRVSDSTGSHKDGNYQPGPSEKAYNDNTAALTQEWAKTLPPGGYDDFRAKATSDMNSGFAGKARQIMKIVGPIIATAPLALGAAGAAGLLNGTALGAASGFGGAAGAAGATAGVTAAQIAGSAGLPELGMAAQTIPAAVKTAGGLAAGLTGVELAKLGLAGVGTLAGYKSSEGATDAANNATDAASKSADAAAQLGRDNLDFTKQQYADALPYREAAAKTAQEVAEAQLAQMKQQDELAREYADYNRTTFRPLEQGIVADAAAYDTPEKRNAAALAAQADVNKGFSAVNDATSRRLAANGINPGSARAMSVMSNQGTEQAKANAGAAYSARKGVETTGFARKMDAASLGRNLPSAQATTAGIALNAGNSATGNSGAALNAVNSGVPQVQNAYNSAVQGASVGGNLYANAAQLAQRAGVISADQWGQLGDSLGQWSNSKGGNAVLNKWFGG